jgi:hypothetical protein
MYFNRQSFDTKCHELAEDVSKRKITSSSWAWMAIGAISGLLLSCVRFKRKNIKPIICQKGKENAEFVSNGDSSLNS